MATRTNFPYRQTEFVFRRQQFEQMDGAGDDVDMDASDASEERGEEVEPHLGR